MKSKWILAGLISLALLVVLAAMAVAVYSPVRSFLTHREINIEPLLNSSVNAEATEVISFNVSGPTTLDVDTSFGDITVTGGDGNEVKITARKTAYGATDAAAQQELEDIKVIATQDGDTIRVRVQPKSSGWVQNEGGSVSFEISVPVETTTTLRTNSGKLELNSVHGKADLSTDFGNIWVRDFQGGLFAHSQSGAVSAQQIGLLDSGDGDVDLASDFGTVELQDAVTNAVKIHTNSGGINLDNVECTGKVAIDSGFGAVNYLTGKAASLDAQTASGSVTLRDLVVAGSVSAQSDYGSVSLSTVAGQSYNLRSNSGKIQLDGASGSITAHSEFGNIQISQAEEALLDLRSQNGRITFEGSLDADGKNNVTSGFGEISLILPSDSAFDFNLTTQLGQIRVDFPIQIQGAPDDKHWVGTVAGGGPLLTVSADNGSLTIQQGD